MSAEPPWYRLCIWPDQRPGPTKGTRHDAAPKIAEPYLEVDLHNRPLSVLTGYVPMVADQCVVPHVAPGRVERIGWSYRPDCVQELDQSKAGA